MSRFLAFKQANWPSLQNAMLTSSAVVAFTPRILLPECLPGRVGCEADALRLLPLRPERRHQKRCKSSWRNGYRGRPITVVGFQTFSEVISEAERRRDVSGRTCEGLS